MEKQKSEILTNLYNGIFSMLHRKLSRYALVLMKKQYMLALDRSNLEGWTGYFPRVHGIPWAHVICSHIKTKRPIQIRVFCKTMGTVPWWWHEQPQSQAFWHIATLPYPENASSQKNVPQSVKRQPSGFERTAGRMGVAKCIHCRETRHDLGRCPTRVFFFLEYSQDCSSANLIHLPLPSF